jgi:hypothetical protein
MKRVTSLVLVAACLAAPPALAQLSAGPVITTFVSQVQEVAYDPGHDAYLYVGRNGPSGAVDGVFIDAASRTTLAPSPMHLSANGSVGIRAVYSPDVSDGAGGLVAFVVMWFEQLTAGSPAPIRPGGLAPPPPPPPPPPPGRGGCATPDPLVAFGGGVCFNGGWHFRG